MPCVLAIPFLGTYFQKYLRMYRKMCIQECSLWGGNSLSAELCEFSLQLHPALQAHFAYLPQWAFV